MNVRNQVSDYVISDPRGTCTSRRQQISVTPGPVVMSMMSVEW